MISEGLDDEEFIAGSGFGRGDANPLKEGVVVIVAAEVLLAKRSLHSPNNSHQTQASLQL